MEEVGFREAISSAIRYWERARIVYNVVLAMVVIATFCASLPQSRSALSVGSVEGLFILAVLANVAFCAAYPVDLFMQMSALRATWLRFRWVLLLIGVLFAGAITQLITSDVFDDGS
jgi:hypothetical protein